VAARLRKLPESLRATALPPARCRPPAGAAPARPQGCRGHGKPLAPRAPSPTTVIPVAATAIGGRLPPWDGEGRGVRVHY
jgi:hypothetical protein